MKYLAGALLALSMSSITYSDTIQFDIGEWPPYTSKSDPNSKVVETVIKEAMEHAGHKVKYSYYPWKRSYENVVEGTSAGTFPWFSNQEREQMFHLSTEVMKNKEVFFYNKASKFDWETYEDLKKYNIGGTVGYSSVKLLESEGLKLSVVAKEENNFKKLQAGRIDAVPAGYHVGLKLISKHLKKNALDTIGIHPKPLTEAGMFILFSKKRPKSKQYAEDFKKGLMHLKESGRYDEIMNTTE